MRPDRGTYNRPADSAAEVDSLRRVLLAVLDDLRFDHSMLVRDDPGDGSPGFKIVPTRCGASEVYVMANGVGDYGVGLGEGVWVELWRADADEAKEELARWVESVLARGFRERLRITTDGSVVSARARLRMRDGRSVALRSWTLAPRQWFVARRRTIDWLPFREGDGSPAR
jgi:hypothetical protein